MSLSVMRANVLVISISIVTYETPGAVLVRCLSFLLLAIKHAQADALDGLSVTVSIINNGACGLAGQLRRLQVPDAFAQADIRFDVIEGQGNVGYGRAHNLAVLNDESDFVLLMNPDVRVAHNTLTEALRHFRSDQEAVCLSPFCRDGDGQRQFLCKNYPSVFDLLLRGIDVAALNRLFGGRLADYEARAAQLGSAPVGVPIVSGCFMFCRRSALDAVSGFDDRYFLYFEDFDLSLRLRSVGSLAFYPRMLIEHDGGGAGKKGIKHIAMFISSACKFFSTHGWKLV